MIVALFGERFLGNLPRTPGLPGVCFCSLLAVFTVLLYLFVSVIAGPSSYGGGMDRGRWCGIEVNAYRFIMHRVTYSGLGGGRWLLEYSNGVLMADYE